VSSPMPWIGALALFALTAAGCGVGTVQTDLREAVDAQQGTLDDCYRQALERDASIAGSLQVRLSIDKGASSVREVEVLDAGVEEALVACVRGVITSLSFAPPSKANVTVDYTLQFQQGSR